MAVAVVLAVIVVPEEEEEEARAIFTPLPLGVEGPPVAPLETLGRVVLEESGGLERW
jgi:hypothetical protein